MPGRGRYFSRAAPSGPRADRPPGTAHGEALAAFDGYGAFERHRDGPLMQRTYHLRLPGQGHGPHDGGRPQVHGQTHAVPQLDPALIRREHGQITHEATARPDRPGLREHLPPLQDPRHRTRQHDSGVRARTRPGPEPDDPHLVAHADPSVLDPARHTYTPAPVRARAEHVLDRHQERHPRPSLMPPPPFLR